MNKNHSWWGGLVALGILVIFMGGCAIWDQKDGKKKAQLYLKIGTSYFAKGDYPNALNQLTIAAQHNPKDPVIQHNLGLSYLVRKKYLKAESHLRKAVQLEKKYTEARNNLARVLIELSLYNEALRELEIAREDLTFPYPEKTLTHLGIVYFKIGSFEEANALLEESLSIRSNDCVSNHFLGRSYLELSEYSKAARFLNKAVDRCQSNDFDEPLYFSALAHYQTGKEEKAISTIHTLINKFPNGQYVERAHKFLEIIQ